MNKIEKQHLLMALENTAIRTLIKTVLAIAIAAVLFSSCNKQQFNDEPLPAEGNNLDWNDSLNNLYKEYPGDVWDTTFTETPTPAPIITGAARTLTYSLVIQNHQLFWSDNTPAKIVEANSPETALAYLDYGWLDWLHTQGVNAIYMTLNGKESGKPRISPYKNNDIAQGFDEPKVNAMVALAAYWCAKDERKILHLLLSEKETHFLYTDAQRKAEMSYWVQKFAPVAGHIIWDREEWPNGQTSQAQNLYGYLQGIDPVNIRAMHNNTNQNPWSGFYNTTLIQFLSFQEWSGNFDRRIRGEVLKFPAGVTGYASEVTGGFQPGDVAKAEQLWNAAPGYNVGVGVYVSCCDQRDTRDNWYRAYQPVYNRIAQLAGNGTTPPPDDTIIVVPPGNIIVEYSTQFSLSPSTVLVNNASVNYASGGLWFGVKAGTAPFTFTLKKGTGNAETFTDSTPIYQFKKWLQRGSAYTLTARDGSGQSVVINFVVR